MPLAHRRVGTRLDPFDCVGRVTVLGELVHTTGREAGQPAILTLPQRYLATLRGRQRLSGRSL